MSFEGAKKREAPKLEDTVARVLEGMKEEVKRRNLEAANDDNSISKDNEALEIRSADDLRDTIHEVTEKDRKAA